MSNDHVHPTLARVLDAISGEATRQARCQCGKTEPSRFDLAFFEARGPGSKYAAITCRRCRNHDISHAPEVRARNSSLTCTTFEPLLEGHDFDGYYCGCSGWD